MSTAGGTSTLAGNLSGMLPLITMLAVAAPATLTLRLGPCSEPSALWSWDGSTHAVSPRTKGAGDRAASAGQGETDRGFTQGAHLNPPGASS